MLRKGIKTFKKNKQFINSYIIIFFTTLSVVFFYSAFHNLDLLSNYSLIFNDVNKKSFIEGNLSGYYDLREIQDCNGYFQCPDYKTIYIGSVNLLFLSYNILFGLLISIGLFHLRGLYKRNKKK